MPSGIAILLVTSAVSQAEFIRMTIEVAVETNTVEVVLTNDGDDPATMVQTVCRLGDQTWTSKVIDELTPGDAITNALPFDLSALRGTWPLEVDVRYSDENGHPFSAISCATVSGPNPVISDVAGELEPLQISGKGTLRGVLRNRSDIPIEVTLRPVISSDFNVGGIRSPIKVPPREQKKIRLKIANFSATPGSIYPAFLLAEYEEDGIHHTAILESEIEVVDAPSSAGMSWQGILWISICAAVLIIVVGIVFLRAIPRPPSPGEGS